MIADKISEVDLKVSSSLEKKPFLFTFDGLEKELMENKTDSNTVQTEVAFSLKNWKLSNLLLKFNQQPISLAFPLLINIQCTSSRAITP